MLQKNEIPGFPGYLATSAGNIISIKSGKTLPGEITKLGYRRVHIKYKQSYKRFSVHRLVCMAFNENKNNKPQVNHIDGNKLNNVPSNLEWVTAKENTDHAVLIGIKPRGEKHGMSKLTSEQVLHIKRKVMSSHKYAKLYGMGPTAIKEIMRGITWVHIKSNQP